MVKHKEPGLGLSHSLDVKAVDPELIQLLRSKLLALPRQRMLAIGALASPTPESCSLRQASTASTFQQQGHNTGEHPCITHGDAKLAFKQDTLSFAILSTAHGSQY